MQVLITSESDSTLWQLSGRQRLQKQFTRFPEVRLIDTPAQRQPGAPLLLIRGDFIYVQQLIQGLVANTVACVLTDNRQGEAVAIWMSSHAAARDVTGDVAGDDAVSAMIARLNSGEVPTGFKPLPAQEFVAPYDVSLRKHEAVEVYKIAADKKVQLENFLFGNAYKGVTDCITRFIWPYPARWATYWCTTRAITPNQVTLLSLLLVIASGFLFWHGWFLTGLLCAWVMTFLDTVDGKLARVTISTSKTGHVLDHGMDIIHPPLWYYAWGMGLVDAGLPDAVFVVLMWVMLLAYVGGRLIEGGFELFTPITIFTWRRFDSYHRLVTARRNPNLVLLTGFTLAGQPVQGLYAVVAWHVISTAVLVVRTGQIWQQHKQGQPMTSWLMHLTSADKDVAVRLFAGVRP